MNTTIQKLCRNGDNFETFHPQNLVQLSKKSINVKKRKAKHPKITKSPMYLNIKNTTINKNYFHFKIGLQKT